jgi:hypothetical protein
LTLLECGVPASDPVIQRATEAVRQASVRQTHTYSIALAILLLDRLREQGDHALIHSLAIRLLAGQNASGGWSYWCPAPGADEVRRLQAILGKRRNATLERGGRIGAAGSEGTGLSPEIQKLLSTINPKGTDLGPSDNSNTKFATLALWVARRHGMPVGEALRLVEKRFRDNQNPDGGWGYLTRGGERRFLEDSTATMTCSGLLGLAIGVAYESVLSTGPAEPGAEGGGRMTRRDPNQDPVIRAGIGYLTNVLARPLAQADDSSTRLYGPLGNEYYLLWAIERVAVAYSLSRIGNADWYAWGSEFLLKKQGRDGSWEAGHIPDVRDRRSGVSDDEHRRGWRVVNTCFALLFLEQANLSKDLTITLRGNTQDQNLGGQSNLEDRRSKETTSPATQSPAPPANEKTSETPNQNEKAVPEPATPSSAGAEADDLIARLVQAAPAQQVQLIQQYQENKGGPYTEALAGAIAKLSGSTKGKARDALAERMARMTAATIQDRLKDSNAEIRRAAALACAMKDDKTRVPDLIPLLEDSETSVGHAAHAALKSLTNQDFGPPTVSTAGDRHAAVTAWKKWWDQQGK